MAKALAVISLNHVNTEYLSSTWFNYLLKCCKYVSGFMQQTFIDHLLCAKKKNAIYFPFP